MMDSLSTIQPETDKSTNSPSENDQFNPLLFDEILHILRFYLSKKDLLAGRSVCKLWRTEFSSLLTLRIKDEDSFNLITNQVPVAEVNLDNPFSKFDLRKLENEKIPPDILGYLPSIKELSLPLLDFKKWESILRIISPTIQVLLVQFDLFEKEELENMKRCRLFKNSSSILPEEECLIMKNLKKVTIKVNFWSETMIDSGFFEHFFRACHSAVEIDVYSEEVIRWLFLEILSKEQEPYLNLKKLSINRKNCVNEWLKQNFVLKLIEFADKMKKQGRNEIKIKIFGITLLLKDVFDFFHIIAAAESYWDERFRRFPTLHLATNSKMENFKRIQINSVEKINDCFQGWKMSDVLYHFPKLNHLFFKDIPVETREGDRENWTRSIMLLDSKTRYEDLKSLKYLYLEEITFLEENFTSLFPNLTKLHLKLGYLNSRANTIENIGFKLIYAHLKKLQVFKINLYRNVLTDENFTGIPEEDVKKYSDSNLCYCCYRHHDPHDFSGYEGKGIESLLDLREFELKIDKDCECSNCNVNLCTCKCDHLIFEPTCNGGGGDGVEKKTDSRKLTQISLFYGFNRIKKLKSLKLKADNMKHIPTSCWNIFIDEFEKLEYLEVSKSVKEVHKSVFEGIEKNRPYLFKKV